MLEVERIAEDDGAPDHPQHNAQEAKHRENDHIRLDLGALAAFEQANEDD